MEPFSIPSVSAALPSRGDDSSSASEEARRDQRRVEASKATAFRMAMERSTGAPPSPPTVGRTIATGWNSGQAAVPVSSSQVGVPAPDLRKGATHREDQALSPSLLKLRAGTARLTGPAQTPKPAPQLPVARRNLSLPPAGGLPVYSDQVPLPPVPPRHPGTRYDSDSLPTSPQIPLLQGINPAAESGRLEARASGHDGKKKEESGTSEDAPAVDSGADRSGLPFPMPNVGPRPLPSEAPQVERITPPATLVQQVVEFATVAPNRDGFMEFRLGLARNALGGLRVRVCAYGNRRVGLSVHCGEGDAAIHEGHVSGLIEALRQRDVDVVETVFE